MEQLSSPQVIDHRLQTVRVLGRGCSGEVYECHYGKYDHDWNFIPLFRVAAKVFDNDQDFEDEVRIHKCLQLDPKAQKYTPNLISTTIWFRDSTARETMSLSTAQGVIMTELCGPNLEQFLETSVDRTWDYAKQIFKGIKHFHRLGIVHWDIASKNLVWDKSGERIKICDFGHSFLESLPSPYTANYPNAEDWRGPEDLFGGDYAKSWDMWCAGGTLLELCTEQDPSALVLDISTNSFSDVATLVTHCGWPSAAFLRQCPSNPYFTTIDDEFVPTPALVSALQTVNRRSWFFSEDSFFVTNARCVASNVTENTKFEALQYLIQGCLRTDPVQRLTVIEALEYMKQF
ncbi:MAG: protein kinase family protein [Chlamydiales bacterium]|nr:protein kinase family protein [Chlamydiales bacterium]